MRLLIGMRAAGITLNQKGFPFSVELSEISGSETFLHIRHEMIGVVGLLDSVQNFNTGEIVRAQFDIMQLYVFDQNEQLVSSPYHGLE